MSETMATPLAQDPNVKQLLSVMEANNANTGNLLSMLGYVASMERQLDTAVRELASMRRELGQMREAQNHPVRTALQNVINTLESKISILRERLNAVKQSIIAGCKKALAAFREKGVSALHNVMSFFRVRETLVDIQKGMNAAVQSAERSIAKIEAVSTEYHEIGRHIKNIGRAMTGKEFIGEAKPVGRIAKTAQAPHKVRKAIASKAAQGVGAAIGRIDKSREAQAVPKPSVLKTLNDLKERDAQEKRDAPKLPARQREASI